MIADVFLIGSGQTRFTEHWDLSLRDLIDSAIEKAIENADISVLDIDFVIVSNMLAESVNNQSHLGSLVSSLLPHRPPAIRVEAACASGSVAIHTACALLESKKAETVLIVGAEKMTDSTPEEISRALMGAADNEEDQPSGLTFPGIFGLITNRYMRDYGLTRDQLSLVSSAHHKNALRNPNAQFRREVSAEEVSKSLLIADPIRQLDCSPVGDGAAACILSVKSHSPIRITASQIANDTLSVTKRASLTSFPATGKAMKNALKEANINREDIAHIEMHDCFSIAAVINMEDMGFSGPGKGIGWYTRKHACTLNQSGGLKACGHPVAATGVKQIVDIAKQLSSSRSRYGLTHNLGGAGATCGIHILENTNVMHNA